MINISLIRRKNKNLKNLKQVKKKIAKIIIRSVANSTDYFFYMSNRTKLAERLTLLGL